MLVVIILLGFEIGMFVALTSQFLVHLSCLVAVVRVIIMFIASVVIIIVLGPCGAFGVLADVILR